MNPENKENISPNIISQYLSYPSKAKRERTPTPEFSKVPQTDDHGFSTYISDQSRVSFRGINPLKDEPLSSESIREVATHIDSLTKTCHCDNGRNSELEQKNSQLRKDYTQVKRDKSSLEILYWTLVKDYLSLDREKSKLLREKSKLSRENCSLKQKPPVATPQTQNDSKKSETQQSQYSEAKRLIRVLEQDLKSSGADLEFAIQRNLSFTLEANERESKVTELQNEQRMTQGLCRDFEAKSDRPQDNITEPQDRQHDGLQEIASLKKSAE